MSYINVKKTDYGISKDLRYHLERYPFGLWHWLGTILIIQLFFYLWCINWKVSFYFIITLLPAFVFWLYGWHITLSAIFSNIYWTRLKNLSNDLKNVNNWPPIALFYLCCDDFQKDSLMSLIGLNYPEYKIFVLDDSQDPLQREEIKGICKRFPNKAIYHHRSSRTGYKAGNINQGLSLIGGDFQFIALFDADSKVQPEFLKELYKWFQLDPRIAFVQGLHEASHSKNSHFAKCLGFTVGAFWRFGLIWKIWDGLVLNFGHGNLIRVAALRDIGGIPEVTSEDIALTYELRLKGWMGLYAPVVMAQEEFPRIFSAYRQRTSRWTRQDMNTFMRYTRRLFACKNISLPEKFDATLKNLKYPFSGLVVPYLLGLALVTKYCPSMIPVIDQKNIGLIILIALLFTNAPLIIYLFYSSLHSRRFFFSWLALICFILTTCNIYFTAMIRWCLNKNITFSPTGKASHLIKNKEKSAGNRKLQSLNYLEQLFEILLCLAFILVGFSFNNFIIVIFGIGIFFGILLDALTLDTFWKYAYSIIAIGLIIAVYSTFMSGIPLFTILLSLSVFSMLYA